MSNRRRWTRQELLVAFGLYCRMPFGKLHKQNPEIIKIAGLIGRTPSALAMKLTNIASLDPEITATGRKGLTGASAADRAMWQEMKSGWEKVASHIVPWHIDSANRLNPRNGLALSVLHDKAFDLGMITINEDMTVRVSKKEFRMSDDFVATALKSYDGKSIELPDKFRPDEEFLDYHRQNIFAENG